MTMPMLGIAALALAVVALLVWRQLRWTRFEAARALRLPVVLGVLGLVEVATAVQTGPPASADVVLLAAELAVALAVGTWQTRTGWLGAGLWLVLIAVRVGISTAGPALGAHVATTSGVLLLLLAATRATAALIARSRAPQAALLSA